MPHRRSSTSTHSLDLSRRIPAQRGRPITVVVRQHRTPGLDAASRAVVIAAAAVAVALIVVLAVFG